MIPIPTPTLLRRWLPTLLVVSTLLLLLVWAAETPDRAAWWDVAERGARGEETGR